MVKSKDDYDKRMDDSRFARFDAAIDPSYGQKQFKILTLGVIVLFSIIAITTSLNYLGATEIDNTPVYEEGLNISYIASAKEFNIAFSNPNSDTLSVATSIKIPFDSQSTTMPYLTVYEYTTSEFPINLTYTPALKSTNINHIVTVTLVKTTGNYTYAYSIVPDTENKMWEGTGKYVNKIKQVFNQT